MESHHTSTASRSAKQPYSVAFLTPAEKQKLHKSKTDFASYTQGHERYQKWKEKFEAAGFKVSKLK